jgi:membrane protease YdiL (CAAX protease family)
MHGLTIEPLESFARIYKTARGDALNTEIEDMHARDSAMRQPTGPSDVLPPSAPPSMTHTIFFGEDGLRAGWSLLLYIAMFAAAMFCAHAIGNKIHPPKVEKATAEHSLRFLYIVESVPLAAAILLTWLMSKIERRRNAVYGLGGRRGIPQFFAGLAWGVTCLSVLVFMLVKTGLMVIDSRLLFGGNAFRYGALWLLGFMVVALLEEYLVRGYLQYTLSRGLAGVYRWAFKTRHSKALGFWTAALIFSILFGLSHEKNPGESPIGLLSAGLAAMIFCLSLWRTGSLWWAIGFHASWDWAQSFLYGVADSGTMVQHHLLATHPVGRPILSGGTTGPEGSIFIIAVVSLIAAIIMTTLPRTKEDYAANLPTHPIEP